VHPLGPIILIYTVHGQHNISFIELGLFYSDDFTLHFVHSKFNILFWGTYIVLFS
jgi:hypothetical protein